MAIGFRITCGKLGSLRGSSNIGGRTCQDSRSLSDGRHHVHTPELGFKIGTFYSDGRDG